MRLFFGLPFDAETCAAVRRVQSLRLEECAQRGRFTDPGNFHLTLAFLGEVEEERLKTLGTILRENPIPPIDLLFDRLGQFGGGIYYLAPRTCPTLFEGAGGVGVRTSQGWIRAGGAALYASLDFGAKSRFFGGRGLVGVTGAGLSRRTPPARRCFTPIGWEVACATPGWSRTSALNRTHEKNGGSLGDPPFYLGGKGGMIIIIRCEKQGPSKSGRLCAPLTLRIVPAPGSRTPDP